MNYEIKIGDSLTILKTMDDESVHCCVTSPPYWALRNYDHIDQLGQEPTPEEYVDNLVEIFHEVKRVLRDDGTLWLNLGDSYVGTGAKSEHKDPKNKKGRNAQSEKAINNKVQGLKPKDMVGIPWRVAFALQADGWYLRSDIIWHKNNCMPSSVKDRPTSSYEHIFLFAKSKKYYYDKDAILEPLLDPNRKDTGKSGFGGLKHTGSPDKTTNATYSGRKFDATKLEGKNKRDVWTVATRGYKGAHFAVYPSQLIEPCVLAGTSEKGCCSKCGAPLKRDTKRNVTFHSGSGKAGNPPKGKHEDNIQSKSGNYDIRMGTNVEIKTLGWKPTCDCFVDSVPCTTT
jgi:DNA modification methylase